jgi:hypothetical protein
MTAIALCWFGLVCLAFIAWIELKYPRDPGDEEEERDYWRHHG